jgi:hypothetical protein
MAAEALSAILAFTRGIKDMDDRDKPGRDE